MKTIRQELDEWIGDDKVVADRVIDEHGTTIVVTQNSDDPRFYCVFRGFDIGGTPYVSVDSCDHLVGDTMQYLLNHYEL